MGVTAVVGVRNVWKVFGPTVAVADTSFDIGSGEVLALLGENGAGKSTCVKMLAGLYQPDRGTIEVDQQPVELHSPHAAAVHGIAIVHQHPGLFGDLSLAENIYASHPLRDRLGLIDHRAMRAKAADLLELLGLDRDPATEARRLRTSEQQLVEIAKALAFDCRALVLDEPTAALTSSEVDRLFGVVRNLRDRGTALMFVGHRLDEIFAISDRMTIMRDGAVVANLVTADTTRGEVVAHMVGRQVDSDAKRVPHTGGAVVLATEHLTSAGEFSDVSITVRAGEVVGLAGLVGAGRTEIARAVFGITAPTSGQILLDGTPVTIESPAAAIDLGIAYVSEDRRGQSLIEDFSILDNASLPIIDAATRSGLIDRDKELGLIAEPLQRMRLRFASYLQPARSLSGGNQQKVALAKWLASSPRLLILDEPTQGIDVQAKAEVHRIIDELAAAGMAVLVISSDMPELIALSDRAYVLRHGHVTAELVGDALTPLAIGLAATASDDPAPATNGTAAPVALVGSVPAASGAAASGAVGSGATASGAAGAGAVGSGAVGSGATASGVAGSGAVGSGAAASGAVGSGAAASGAVASGVVASGVVVSGAVGSGAAASGAVGSGGTSGAVGSGAVASGAVGSGSKTSGSTSRAANSGSVMQAGWGRRLLARRETGLALALLGVIVPLTIYNSNFYTASNIRDLFVYASLIGIVGLGQMFVVLTRNIDLSVASTLGLAAYAAAATMRAHPNATVLLGIAVAVAVGLVCGAVNGLLVGYGDVPSIVVTLGTLAVFRGVLSTVSSGDRVKPTDVEAGNWLDWTRYQPLGIPIIAIIGLTAFVIGGFVLRRTRIGRQTFCIGSNPDGAALVGIRVRRQIAFAFTVCGTLAGFVGALWASYYPYVDGQVAIALELTVISGVVVGGVALRGGAGTVTGVALGTVGLLAIRKALTIAGVADQYLMAIYGAAIIVAVSVDVIVFANRQHRRVAT